MDKAIKNRIEQIQADVVPDGYYASSGYVIPDGWKLAPFNSVFLRVTQKNDENNTNVLTISAQQGLISQMDYYISAYASEDKRGYSLLNNGDYSYNKSYSSDYPYGAIKRLEKYEKGIVSPLYICFTPKEGTNSDYYIQYFEAGIFNREIYKIAQEGARNHGLLNVSVEDFFDSILVIPPMLEQQKIAKILMQYDRVIELKQVKIKELRDLKKACLDKMFPKDGSSVPEIRFPGFSDSWEQRKLREVLVSLQNNTLSRAELSSEQGAALNVHYGDVLIKFGECLDIKKEALPMIPDRSVVAKYKASFLQNGDVIVADTAEDETVGKCSEIAGLTDETAISGLHTIPYRPLIKFATGYLGYYMNSGSYHHQLLPLMQGIKVTSISKTAMQNTIVRFPKSEEEQANISTFFRNLDNLITLHQRELEENQKYKKALMQLLLTGKVRVCA